MRKALFAISAFSVAAFLAGCGGSSTSAADESVSSSSEALGTISSSSENGLSSSGEEILSSA